MKARQTRTGSGRCATAEPAAAPAVAPAADQTTPHAMRGGARRRMDHDRHATAEVAAHHAAARPDAGGKLQRTNPTARAAAEPATAHATV